jgi:phosphopantothenoylcysteine decarboxylase/phosphopantothenate--cysteine ligase
MVLGVTGGIAAYKAAELARLLAKAGANVQVVMTEGAAQFVTPVTFQALTGRRSTPTSGMAASPTTWRTSTSRAAPTLILVAPASADFLAKVAHGLADDLLSTWCWRATAPS